MNVQSFFAAAALATLALGNAAAAEDAPAPHMAPAAAYLMDRAEEIALARSAAPASISKAATVLVLTRTGYETAVTGTNGFVCRVGRGFGGAFDWPERFNPKIRAAECLNPAAARSVLPFSNICTAMFLAGHTTEETIARIEAALASGEIPPLESGAMSYMMSRGSYLTDLGSVHDMPHVMFFVAVDGNADWGANAPDSPILGSGYWYFFASKAADAAGLPPLRIFITGVPAWSDGTTATMPKM